MFTFSFAACCSYYLLKLLLHQPTTQKPQYDNLLLVQHKSHVLDAFSPGEQLEDSNVKQNEMTEILIVYFLCECVA